jgi:hypothetical protein
VKRLWAAVLVICSLIGVLAVQAIAHKQKIPTSTTVIVTPDPVGSNQHPTVTYSGKISSPNPKCVAGRTVLVIVSQSGIQASVKSDGAGNWSTPHVTLGADEIGVQAKTLKKNKKHKHVCKTFGTESF